MIELMTILGVLIIGPIGMVILAVLIPTLIVKHVKKKRAEKKRLEEEAEHQKRMAEFYEAFKMLAHSENNDTEVKE